MFAFGGESLAREGFRRFRLMLVGCVVLAEVLVVTALYQFGWDSGCPAGLGYCDFLKSLVGRGFAVAAIAAIILPLYSRHLVSISLNARHGLVAPSCAANLFGVALVLLPLLGGPAVFPFSATLWTAGAILIVAGGMAMAVPWRSWARILREVPPLVTAVLAAGFFLPDLVWRLDDFWYWSPLTKITFSSVGWVLSRLTDGTFIDPEFYEIGIDGFIVEVGAACSGLQGFGLVACLVGVYLVACRDELRFPNVLLLLPIGILASFVLNIARITLLIWIGRYVDPVLAVDGFHSYAGWLFFTILAFGLIALGQRVAWFRKRPEVESDLPPLRSDPNAFLILPFVAMMAFGLVSNTFLPIPGLGYPLKILACGLVLALFASRLRELQWVPALLPVGLGVVVGLLWLVTKPPSAEADEALVRALATLPPVWVAVWICLRVVGTAVVVPLVEELFFRGYMFKRFDAPGWTRFVALVVSSAAFALLHERWLAAFLAGIAYALVTLRRGRLTDAIFAHAVTNAVIAAWAVGREDWAAI